MTADDAEEWPEPNPRPHLTPLRTTAEIADEVLLFSPLEILVVGAVIAAVEAVHIATGEPAVTAVLNGLLALALILALGALAEQLRGGEL